MPTTTSFILISDKILEGKVEALLQANGLEPRRWTPRLTGRNPYGLACLITDSAHMQAGAADQPGSGLVETMPIIVMTPRGDVAAAVQAVKQGAFDVLEAPLNEKALLSTVLRALEQCRQANRTTDILDSIRRRMSRLTARESQILDLLVVGKTNKEVALKLAISVRTVEIHRAHVMEKMRARNMPQLVRMVIAATEQFTPSSSNGYRGVAGLPAQELAFT